jgi:O-antigen ligase
MACGLPILWAIAGIRLREGTKAGRILTVALFTSALLLMALAATGSRMGLLLGGIGVASAAIILRATAGPLAVFSRGRSRLWLAGVAVVIAAAVPIAVLVARGGALGRLGSSDLSNETRLAALRPMFQAARTFLPFGTGFGTFDPVYRQFEPDSLLSTIYLNQAHDEPIQLAIEGGIPALLLLLLFLGWWIRSAARAVRPRESAARRALGIAMTASTLILMLSSLVDYPLRTPLLSGLFAIACVELVRSKRSAAAPRPDRQPRPS